MLPRRRTNSGAEFVDLDGGCIIKLNDKNAGVRRRLNAQAAWLDTYASRYVVEVFASWDGGYVMRAHDDAWCEGIVVPRGDMIKEVIWMLRRGVWCHQPNRRGHDTFPLAEKWADVRKRLPADITKDAHDLAMNIDWKKVPRVLTHGDPTLANVLRRMGVNEYVLCDPIPASPTIPDVRAVDIGKMLQSALGWEHIAYEWAMDGEYEAILALRNECEGEEWQASVFACVMHVARLIPYYPEFTEQAVELIAREALRL